MRDKRQGIHEGAALGPQWGPGQGEVRFLSEEALLEVQGRALDSFSAKRSFVTKEEVQARMEVWLGIFRGAWKVDQTTMEDWFVGGQDAEIGSVLYGTHEDTSIRNTLEKGVNLEAKLDAGGLQVCRILMRAAVEARAQFEAMRAAMAKAISLATKAPREKVKIPAPNCGFRPAEIGQEKPWAERQEEKYPRGKNNAANPKATEGQEKIIRGGKAAPGTSRHGWGFDFDIAHINNGSFNASDFNEKSRKDRKGNPKYAKEFEWLQEEAWRFGFFRPYSDKTFPGAAATYGKENWHWSYYPAAQAFHALVEDHIQTFDKMLKTRYWPSVEDKYKEKKKRPDLFSYVETVWQDLHRNIDTSDITTSSL